MTASSFLEFGNVINWNWAKLRNPDDRFLGSWNGMFVGSLFYLVLVSVLSIYMFERRRTNNPFGLKIPSVIHNFIMTFYSLWGFLGVSYQLYHNWKINHFDLKLPFCDPNHLMMEGFDFWMYIFYMSKYLEYIDTVFLLLKGKLQMPPTNAQHLLHIFHHTTTGSIVWYSWRHPFSVAWIGPITNLFVHVLMYGYYLATDFGLSRRFGGMFITPIQLVQFVVCILAVVYETINYKECNTDLRVIGWIWFTYVVFLAFFVHVYTSKKEQRDSESTQRRKKEE